MKNLMKENYPLSLAMCIIALGIFSLSQGAEAAQVKEKKEAVVHKGGMGFEARIGVGYLQGEANEWVYDTESGQERPDSKLTWTLDPVLMVGGGITFQPLSWLTLNGDVWTKVSDSSVMDDWDWRVGDYPDPNAWTNWSHHEDTSVEDGLIIDLNATIPVYKTPNLTVQGIIGYLHDHWSWDATKGGTFVYPGDNDEFRGDIGTFPLDGTGITYEHTFDTPYLGIGLGARFNPITINAKVIGSTFVKAEDYDHHSSKGVKYYGDYSEETMIGLTGEVVYDLTESLSLGAVVNYVRYSTMTGDTVIEDYGEGSTSNDPDGCGTELQRTSVNLSLAYRF